MPIKRNPETPDIVLGTHILFLRQPNRETGVTQVWLVFTKATDQMGTLIGTVKWFGRWRKYAFFPEPNMVFEEVCMGEISEFDVALTKAQREQLRLKKNAAKAKVTK